MHRKAELSNALGVRLTSELGKYLGVPLFHDRVSKQHFLYIIDRMSSRLNAWWASSLSLASRVTLAQSALATIPSYIMETTRIPLNICDQIDKIFQDCIWKGTGDSNKVHLVSWDTICMLKSQGGLGFRKARILNNANLMKLGWKLIHNRETLWVQVMRSKYNSGDQVVPDIYKSKTDSNVWKGINQIWTTFQRNFIWRVGNGLTTSFRKDHWIPGVTKLTDLTADHLTEELRSELVANYTLMGSLDFSKISQVLDDDYIDLFHPIKPPEDNLGEDTVEWLLTSSGEFAMYA